jgi:hypothetical protein
VQVQIYLTTGLLPTACRTPRSAAGINHENLTVTWVGRPLNLVVMWLGIVIVLHSLLLAEAFLRASITIISDACSPAESRLCLIV